MSFISSVIINMLEKELSTQTPEIEAYSLQFIGRVAGDLVTYVEKKIGVQGQTSQEKQSDAQSQ